MKKIKRIQMINIIISILCLAVGVIFIKIFEENDLVLGILLGIIIFVLGVCSFIDYKTNKLKKEYEKQEEIDNQRKIREYFEEIRTKDPKIALICDILNNEYIELTTIMDKANLEFSYDYDEDYEEGNYYELSISSKNYNKKNSYYSSLFLDKEWTLLLSDKEEDKIDASKLDDSAIVDLFIEDIKKFIEVTNK